MRCTYKTLTYVLTAILLFILGTCTVVSVALYNNKKMFLARLFFSKSFQRALRVATCNNVLRLSEGGLGDFQPDPDVAPPPSTATVTTTADASDDVFFSLAAAKFAAQVVAILEKAASQKVPPAPRHDTVLLRLLGGVEVSPRPAPAPTRTRSLGWVLRVAAGAGRDRDQIWVAFRGTQSKAEWRQNFNMGQVALVPHDDDARAEDNTSILVHRGFWSVYTEIRAELLNTLNEHLQTPPGATPPTLYVAGHSLGAALAMLCLVDLLVLSPPALAHKFTDVRCYLFGAPRVGNRAFVNVVRRLCADRTHLREFFVLANDDDVVPCLPLAVQPNLDTPDVPCLYAQYPVIRRFFMNFGSYTSNHTLPVYINYLDTLK
jgi:hypothetical protein